MADYAGAVAAIVERYKAFVTTLPTQFQNEDPPSTPWPPADGPFVYFEVLETASDIRGAGLPGNQTWLTLGQIHAQVAAPKGYGFPEHLALAQPIGEVFRAQTFYVSEPGTKIICKAPSIRGGDSASDNGRFFVLKVAIPFEFYFIK